MRETGNKQIHWINCAKLIAILAVMLDHLHGMLYEHDGMQRMTHFAVPLFILLSGITSYLSGSKYLGSGALQVFRAKTKKILVAYLGATLIYTLVMTRGFDFLDFLNALVHFNASGPLYFVALYLQLMLAFYPLYLILKRIPGSPGGCFLEILLGGLLLLFGLWSSEYTNILNIAGGGGKLLGATFLFLFYLGMVAEKHHWFYSDRPWKYAALAVVGGGLTIITELLILERWEVFEGRVPFAAETNPPGILLIAAAVSVLLLLAGVFSLLDHSPLHRVSEALGSLGKHTLYLFLYHKLFLDITNHFLRLYLPLWLKWILYFAAMFCGPLLLEWIIGRIKKGWRSLCLKKEGQR